MSVRNAVGADGSGGAFGAKFIKPNSSALVRKTWAKSPQVLHLHASPRCAALADSPSFFRWRELQCYQFSATRSK
jgi:hypothetical protein